MAMLILAASLLSAAAATNLDLTHGVVEGSQYWIGVQPFVFTKKTAKELPDGGWIAFNEFCTGEHGGTHLDAPFHFAREGWKVGQVPLDHLIVPGLLLDVSAEAAGHPDFELQASHIQTFLQDMVLPDKVVLLVKFGWGQFYNNRTAYYGISGNDTAELHFPGISGAAAQLLVDTGKVVGFGLDTASVDKGQAKDFVAHKIMAAANIYNMENVDLTSTELPASGFTLYVMPMKIMEGTGAPCRVTAIF